MDSYELTDNHKKIIKIRYLQGFSYQDIADEINSNYERVRGWCRTQEWYNPDEYENARKKKDFLDSVSSSPDKEVLKDFETGCKYTPINKSNSEEILSDGSKNLTGEEEFTQEELDDPNKAMIKLGIDPDLFELVKLKKSVYGKRLNEETGEYKYLTSYSVEAKPKKIVIREEYLKDKFTKYVNPIDRIITNKDSEYADLLVIPIGDMHLGWMDIEDYQSHLTRLTEVIKKGYKSIVVADLGDNIDVDNREGTTTSGTFIRENNQEKAWGDCVDIFEYIIKTSLKNSDTTYYISVEGNHDTNAMRYANWHLQRHLENQDRLIMDISEYVYKAIVVEGVFLAFTHGHKGSFKNFTQMFANYFPKEWGETTTREIFTAHKHHLEIIDEEGATKHIIPTAKVNDEYEINGGWAGSQKEFLVYTYRNSKHDSMEAIW